MRPIASVSLDMDNKWSYLKTRGDAAWQSYPSYLEVLVPRVLQFLREHELRITFFMVGQDAALPQNREVLGSVAGAGHEIGNHSFRHEPWLHLYSEAEIADELSRAEEHIERVTAVRPTAFRGPGFSLSNATLRELARRGYVYDATSFPSILNPLAKAYYFWHSNLDREERERRRAMFGSFRDALSPVKPYQWKLDEGRLAEIPVTTMPVVKLPMHFSYLVYLGGLSPRLARIYFWHGLTLCRMTGTSPSLLLHFTDFMGKEDDADLAFFPGMGMPRAEKIRLLADVFAMMRKHYQIGPLKEHLRDASAVGPLPIRDLRPM